MKNKASAAEKLTVSFSRPTQDKPHPIQQQQFCHTKEGKANEAVKRAQQMQQQPQL